MRKVLLILAAGFVVALALSAGSAGASDDGSTFNAKAYKLAHGYLPLNGVATLERAKAHAAAVVAAGKAPQSPTTSFGAAPTSPTAPSVGASWRGVATSAVTPPDANGAIGPSSFIEVVNQKIGIYTRAGATIATANLSTLTGHSGPTDPMILWDPHTQRFYYNVLNINNARMDWGFSKNANPTTIPGSWCNYETSFGYPTTSIPDYPKLGQTQDFLLIGHNFYPTFSSQEATSSDLLWIAKPQGTGTITTCPSAASFASGKITGLQNEDGSQAFTPVPAIQTDPSGTGYVVTMSDIECPPVCGTGTVMTLFTVTDAGGVPVVSAPDSITVGSYQSPASAPQPGTNNDLDTLDGRLTHAVSGFDPRFGATTVWAAHTVLGGAGAQVRWYELNPSTGTVAQSGVVSHPTIYVFNAGISNDRTCTATQCAHGDSMVLGVAASSPSVFPLAGMVSKVGAGAQSGGVVVKISNTFDRNFSCSPCRWGDYGGATPDPAASLVAGTGKVWLSGQWTTGGSLFASGDATWNWEATP